MKAAGKRLFRKNSYPEDLPLPQNALTNEEPPHAAWQLLRDGPCRSASHRRRSRAESRSCRLFHNRFRLWPRFWGRPVPAHTGHPELGFPVIRCRRLFPAFSGFWVVLRDAPTKRAGNTDADLRHHIPLRSLLFKQVHIAGPLRTGDIRIHPKDQQRDRQAAKRFSGKRTILSPV